MLARRQFSADLRGAICGLDLRRTEQELFVSFAIHNSSGRMEKVAENLRRLRRWQDKYFAVGQLPMQTIAL